MDLLTDAMSGIYGPNDNYRESELDDHLESMDNDEVTCPECGSDDIVFVDDNIKFCVDCEFSWY